MENAFMEATLQTTQTIGKATNAIIDKMLLLEKKIDEVNARTDELGSRLQSLEQRFILHMRKSHTPTVLENYPRMFTAKKYASPPRQDAEDSDNLDVLD